MRRGHAGVDERRIGSPAEPRLDQPCDARSRQRRKTDQLGGVVARQRRKQLGVGALFPRAGGHDERDAQFLQAREQEGQVAQGRGVGPVRVVDDQAERPGRGEIRAQPIEAVEDRERRIDPRREGPVGGGRAREAEEAGRHAGRGLQQLGTLALRGLGQRRLEELTDHPEGEPAFQLRPPRPQDAHSAFCRRRARCGDQRRLADPGRPFDHHERAAPGPSLGQRRFDAGQLPAALEQLPGGRR